MNELYKLSNAIERIDDRFILEAFSYSKRAEIHRKIARLGVLAASICVFLGIAMFFYGGSGQITVYAYPSNQKLLQGETITMPGRIDDAGQMKGHPLQFYILGEGIDKIRFSCKNEWISFVDWTEQRGDFGLSKNFTVNYGENEEDYYYLVIDWVPQNVIRKLTDYTDIKIEDLTAEEREDVVVMEVTYLDGKCETLALNIHLTDEGYFAVEVRGYEISDADDFVFSQDSSVIEHQP